MSDDLRENVMNTNIWMRLVSMLVFAVIFGASRLVLVVVIALQFLWVLFSGKRNEQLLAFGSQMATFIYQIYRYLTFNTEKRPFPFDEFPSADALIDDAEPETTSASDAEVVTEAVVTEAEAEPEVKEESAAPKKAPTKRRSRKPAAKKATEEKTEDSETGNSENKD